MCGRFVLSEPAWSQYHASLSLIRPTSISTTISYNIKPTQDVSVVMMRDGAPVTTQARWWFVPHWFKGDDLKTWKQTTFNARIETAHEKPTFRIAWQSNRCLIPASGYYEWTGEKGKKQPHYVTVEQNVPVIFFAGLHSTLKDGTETCTILTRAAEPEIADLHPRMPVIVSGERLERWLTHADYDDRVIADYGRDWTNKFLVRQVAKFGIRDDGPELIEPDGFEF